MNSIRALMRKPMDELSDFEKSVVRSQKDAFKAKKDLEERVGETSFGKFNMQIDKDLPGDETEQIQKKIEEMREETLSLVYGIRGLTKAMIYLTENKTVELNPWQYIDLLGFVKEFYPQTVYGHDHISEGTFLLYRRIFGIVEDNNIPLSKEVQKIIDKGLAGEEISEYQHRYMHYQGLDEREALKQANEAFQKKKKLPDVSPETLN